MWLPWLISGLVGLWVYFDANKLGVQKDSSAKSLTNMGPVGWGVATTFLLIIGLPLYLMKRPEFKRRFSKTQTTPVN